MGAAAIGGQPVFQTLTARDGHRLECWMQPARGPRRGGLVILHEIFGVTAQLQGLARRYAETGLEVAIPALFDRQRRGAVIPFDQAAAGRDLMLGASVGDAMLDTGAAVDALGGKVAVMGFCWGGGLAVRAAQVLDIACAICFYGTRLQTCLDRPLRAPVLGHFGDSDDHTPPDVLAAARAALPGFEMHLYPAGHAFANDARASFVASAAALAHQRSDAFLARHLA
jgi:carboxymethylenebutenolidase